MSSAIIMIVIIIISRVLIELAQAKGKQVSLWYGLLFLLRGWSQKTGPLPFNTAVDWSPGENLLAKFYPSIRLFIHPSIQPASKSKQRTPKVNLWEITVFLLLISDDYFGYTCGVDRSNKGESWMICLFLFSSSSATSDFPWNCAGIKC